MKITCIYCGKVFLAEDIDEIICNECIEEKREQDAIQSILNYDYTQDYLNE